MVPLRTGNPGGDMAAIMARVRKMSDAQLADILAGKDVSVPQFAAMTEAMGRKRLRQAMQGAQAQQQANQPSVKDQLLAEESGLASLPAPNMDSIDMASGGIVAFEGGGEVPRFQNRGFVDPSLFSFGPASTGYVPDPERERQRKIIEEEERIRAERKAGVADFFRNMLKPNVVRMAEERGYNIPGMSREKSVVETGGIPSLITTADQAGDFPIKAGEDAKKETAKKEPAKTGIAALSEKEEKVELPKRDTFGKFEGVGQQIRGGIADINKAKQSDVLLAASKALLGNANLAKAGSEFAGSAMDIGTRSRKEINELNKAANEYEFNLAKAQEAAAQGNDELAFKYATLAEQAKYRTGMLGVYGERNKMLAESNLGGKVSLGLKQADAQALAEAKAKFGTMLTKQNQAQFDAYVRNRARELKMQNPLTRDYADLPGGFGGFNVVQSLPKDAKVFDLES